MQYIHTAIQNVGLLQIIVATLLLTVFTATPLIIALLWDYRLSTLTPIAQWLMLFVVNHHTLTTQGARNQQMIANLLVATLLFMSGWHVVAEVFIINAVMCLPLYHYVIKKASTKRLLCDITHYINVSAKV